MKKLVTLLFVIVFVQMSFGQLNGTKTIDPAGSGVDNYTTFSAAITALNAAGTTSGVTFLIANGTYTEASPLIIDITTNKPTVTATVTFKPTTGATVALNVGGQVTGSRWALKIGTAIATTDYIFLDGSNADGGTTRDWTIKSTAATYGIEPIDIYGDYCTVKNCIIDMNSGGYSGSGYGITLRDASPTATYATIQNNKVTGNNAIQVGRATAGDVTGCLVKGNEIHFLNRGVYVSRASTVTIEDNELIGDAYNGYMSSTCYGVYCASPSGNTQELVIQRNIIRDIGFNGSTSAAQSIRVIAAAGPGTYRIRFNKIYNIKNSTSSVTAFTTIAISVSGTAATNIIDINNNYIAGFIDNDAVTRAGTNGTRGIWLSSAAVYTIYYNSIFITDTNREYKITACLFVGTATANVTLKNNIFYNSNSSTNGNSYVIYHSPAPTTFVYDYNLLYKDGVSNSFIGYDGTADRAALVDWQTATSKDANSKSVAVSFTSTTDLHIAGQSVGDYTLACNPIDGYTTDIDANTRSTSKPYMGADENTNIPLAAAYKRTVDADATDWTGTASGTLHASLVSNEEAVYTGESGDARTDQNGGDGGWINNDITEFRYTRDDSYLYFMVKFNNIDDINRPYVAIGIDANQSDDTPAWIGDDSPVSLSPATNRSWERQLTIHAVSSGVVAIEMFADDGSSWYAPLSNYQVLGSATNEVIEGRISLFDLGITTSSTLKLAIATFNNVVGYNNVVDATTASYIDVVTPGYAGSNNAWFRAGSSDNLGSDVSWSQALSALPVELTSFSSAVHGKEANLTWKTATEVNSYGFEIQKSEVRSQNDGWEKVGFVQASGNSNSPREYTFTDNNLQEGKYQYRLKMIDNDGTFEYSSIIEAEITAPKEFVLSQNYPNPFNPVTTINYALPLDSKVMLVVYSINGEKVAELVNEMQIAGSYNIPFSARGLASGTYLYRLQAGAFVQTKKMIILK